ncbi:MAG: hypothetical protein KGY75_10445, partial [Candidatus Cloacimonetes bacterium]|nr:hypothetical protein [Candidatus Cloacimonadota bacterium]MBS3768522.1 hypothetical protein [Candidatus Cloacimonadota bacterium]
MKTKITIILISLFLLAFSAQAVAQTKDATIAGAKTGDDADANYNVDYLDVQTTSALVDDSVNWTGVVGDFYVMDPATSQWFGVDSLNTGDTADDQYFRVFIDEAAHTYGPGETDLEFKYTAESGIAIPTNDGDLQPTYSEIQVADGIYPVILESSLSGESNHESGGFTNPTLAVDGDSVFVQFVTTEAIAFSPAPEAWMFDTNEISAVEIVQTDGYTDQKHWTAKYYLSGSHEEGLVDLRFQISDPSVNTTNVSFDDPIDVIYKDSSPTDVYVNDDWTSQTDVDGDDPSLIWLWDAFKTIQEGVDAVASNGSVNVYYA